MDAGEALAPQKHNSPAKGKGRAAQHAAQPRQIWSIATVDALPLLLAFAMASGAGAYFLAPAEPDFEPVLLAPLAMSILIALGRRFLLPSLLQLCVWLAFGAALGMSSAALRARLVAAPVIVAETGPVMVEGWLSEIETGAKGPRLRIDVHAIAGLTPETTPKTVRLTHRSRLEVSSGRFVRCWGVLRPPPAPSMEGEYDFRRQAWFEQLGGVGYVQGRCRGGTLGAPDGILPDIRMKVAAFRRQLAAHVNIAAGDRAGGFAAALVSGDRSYMRVEDQVALRNSGLAHLLAISGLHMAIVGGLVFYLMRRLLACIEPLALRVAVQKPAAIIALAASLAYLILSGAGVSTQRAFIMLAVVFGAVLFDRAALSLRSFAIAMILVILLQPESVMTPGFQMSFAASGALIATYEAWTARRSASDKVLGSFSYSWASLAVTSLVAGTATAPYALYHFDRLAGLGLLANLAAMPVITFVSARRCGRADPHTIWIRRSGLACLWLFAGGHSLDRPDVYRTGTRRAVSRQADAGCLTRPVQCGVGTGCDCKGHMALAVCGGPQRAGNLALDRGPGHGAALVGFGRRVRAAGWRRGAQDPLHRWRWFVADAVQHVGAVRPVCRLAVHSGCRDRPDSAAAPRRRCHSLSSSRRCRV